MSMNQITNQLTKEQKTGFVLLLLFGLISVGLGFLQLRNTIYSPFVITFAEEEVPVVTFEDEASRLQRIDTDQDGINDYLELEFYGTSPYLADTDSDGIDDKEEIDAGTDPLCPKGKVCGSALPSDQAVLTNVLEQKVQANSQLDITQSGFGNESQEDLLQLLSQDNSELAEILSNPDQLRALLVESGAVKAEDLEGISDEMLLELTKSVLQKQKTAEETGVAQ